MDSQPSQNTWKVAYGRRWMAVALVMLLHGWGPVTAPVAANNVASENRISIPPENGLVNIQRTMRLLATSKPEHPNTVRILFYGQSITEQGWWKLVEADLRTRFPHANLIVENRAIGGHSSQLLVKTAEADLYPFQPDLVIFHVYGSHLDYEQIFRNIRERTTAEILQQTDHVIRPSDMTEETDPAKLPPRGDHWDAFMNHNWLPAVHRKYQTTLCDVRAAWKATLKEQGLSPQDFLRDAVHLNEAGEKLMAEIVSQYLVHQPELGPSPLEAAVTEYAVGDQLKVSGNTARLEFDGCRAELIVTQQPGQFDVTIDGMPPGQFPSSYVFTRTSAAPHTNWPVILKVGSHQARIAERWMLRLYDVANDGVQFRFVLMGSETGPDGEGSSDKTFVSNSGRVTIDPADWNLAYARRVQPDAPKPMDGFPVTWEAVLTGATNPVRLDGSLGGVMKVTPLVEGLPNGRHRLVLEGEISLIQGVRVYRPLLVTRP